MWEILAKRRFNKWRCNSTFNQNGDPSEHTSLAPGPLEIQAGVPLANSNSLRGRRNLDPELFCDEVDVKQAKSFDWIKEDAL